MRLPITLIAAAALGMGVFAAGNSPAKAAQLAPANPAVSHNASPANPMVEEVQYRRRGVRRHRGFHGHRGFRGPRRHAYRHYHPRRHYRRGRSGAAAAAGIFGFALGAMAGQALAQPRTYYRGGRHDAHVRWCLNRYRSYDVRSDTFLSYDGNRYYCNSPYR